MKTEVQFEVSLQAKNYSDFESCKQDTAAARAQATKELEALFPREVREVFDPLYEIKAVDFQEFDSTIESQASGYWLVTVEVEGQALFDALLWMND